MKKIHLIAAVCAVAGALFIAGCASAPADAKTETPAEAKAEAKDTACHFISMEQSTAAQILSAKTAPEGLVPGVHVSNDLGSVLCVCKPASVSYDEDGMLRVRVVADTDELPFLTWLICPNRTYRITYCFVWFDEGGKICKGMTPADCREVMPGDPVRFSAKATDGKVKKFALILAPGCSGKCEKSSAPAEKK